MQKAKRHYLVQVQDRRTAQPRFAALGLPGAFASFAARKDEPELFGYLASCSYEGAGMSMKTPVTQVERIWRVIGSLAVVLTIAYFAVS